jgi:pantoate--beta-alanine ligase
MLTLHSVIELRDCISRWRFTGQRVALVPTMGNLHAGHLKLVEHAREHAERVVVSIFVNPLQFGPSEDFKSYPRTLNADKTQLLAAKADLLFAPPVAEMYPGGVEQLTRVEVPELSVILDGKFRPGHFIGVATVVAKLFNMVQPDVALFGEKDYQQLAVIRRMATDLSIPVEIVAVPTLRESDGLALSSRNQYLTPAEHELAPLLYRVLSEVTEALRQGRRDFQKLESEAVRKLSEGMRPDYVSIRTARTLLPAAVDTAHFVVLAAVWLGKARLIDNIEVDAETRVARADT